MILTATVTIQNQTTNYDAEGLPVIVWTANQTTEQAGHQPLSDELEYKSYGVNDGITDRFFLKTTSAAKENGRILDAGIAYIVRRIKPYPNHWEATARKVVE